MQSLNLAIELSNMAIQEMAISKSSSELIQKTKNQLNNQKEALGRYINCALGKSKQMKDIQMEEYQLEYEKKTLAFQLIYFKPRGYWQIQNFQVLSA